jgi:hypothetical protein
MRFASRLIGLLIVVVLVAVPAIAQEVRVTVVAVLATSDKNAPKPDKELSALAAAIQINNPELVGFRRGVMTNKPVAIGSEDSFPLVDGETATVTVMQGVDNKKMIRVKVKPPGLNEITLNSCCGKFVPFLTSYETKDKKERLIIAVMVNPCPCK